MSTNPNALTDYYTYVVPAGVVAVPEPEEDPPFKHDESPLVWMVKIDEKTCSPVLSRTARLLREKMVRYRNDIAETNGMTYTEVPAWRSTIQVSASSLV